MTANNIERVTTTSALHLLVPLENEKRDILTTKETALHLNRSEQTLRIWACTENGAIRPIRVHGRLGWKVADIRRLLAGE